MKYMHIRKYKLIYDNTEPVKLPMLRALCLRQCDIKNFNTEESKHLLQLPELRYFSQLIMELSL